MWTCPISMAMLVSSGWTPPNRSRHAPSPRSLAARGRQLNRRDGAEKEEWMSLARDLAEFLTPYRAADLPAQTVEYAAMLIARTIASAAMGSTRQSAQISRARGDLDRGLGEGGRPQHRSRLPCGPRNRERDPSRARGRARLPRRGAHSRDAGRLLRSLWWRGRRRSGRRGLARSRPELGHRD